MKPWKQWIQEAFSEEGAASSSRILTAVVVCFAMGWTTAIVHHARALPDFGGLCLLIGTLYGINKVASASAAIAGK